MLEPKSDLPKSNLIDYTDEELTQRFQDMGLEKIEVVLQNNIAEVYMNNPPHNNVSVQVLKELSLLYEECMRVEENSTYQLKGIIISSKNKRAFSSGASLDMLNDLSGKDNENRKEFFDILETVKSAMNDYHIPTIAAINGICLGAGFEVALQCHYRVCGKGVFFGFPEITLGLMPGAGGTQMLPRLIGRSRAIYMMLSGKFFSAEEVYRMGAVDKVVERKNVMNAARNIAAELCNHNSKATQYLLKAVDEGLDMSLMDGWELEQKLFWELVDDKIAEVGGMSDSDVGLNILGGKK